VTVRIYRMGVAPTAGLCYGLITTLADNASTTFVDNVAPPSCTTAPPGLPRSENRVANMAVNNWYSFVPGNISSTSPFGGDDLAAATPLAHNAKGWIAEGPGSVHFQAGTWRFVVPTRSVNTSGAAKLTVGLWKVRDDGTVTDQPLGPTNGTQTHSSPGSLVTTTSVVQVTTVDVAVGAFSLAENEHLYLQLWRNQTTGYSFSAGSARIVTLIVGDGQARVEHPTALPDPSLPAHTAPDDAASSTTWPDLSARFDDPVAGDTGTLDFQLCADSACATVLESGSSASGIANGATATWSPAAQAHGTYHWRVRAQDAGGGISSWSSTRTFTYAAAPALPPAEPEPAPAGPPWAPVGFGGSISADGLTLKWSPPLGGAAVAYYALYVNGLLATTFEGATQEAKLGPLDPTDGRTFALAAVDAAGNASSLSPTLVGVPSLVGLDRKAAVAVAAARGLLLANRAMLQALGGSPSIDVVVGQGPETPALVEVGTELTVTVVTLPALESLAEVARESVSCATKRRLSVGVLLRGRARVAVVLMAARGQGDWRRVAAARATLLAGARTVRLSTPALRGSLRYELRVTVTAGTTKETYTLALRTHAGRAGALFCAIETDAGRGTRAALAQ